MTHKEQAVGFIFTLFAAALLVISASTTFGFFYRFFTAWLPAGLVSSDVAAIVSGMVGVLLFDVASLIWLWAFLFNARTSEQRAISLVMAGLTFVGAAAASIAHLGLTASGDIAFDGTTANTIGMAALITVIGGVVVNFGSSLLYSRYSPDNKERVRLAERADKIAAAEQQQAAALDELVASKIESKLAALADSLAEQQAAELASRFYHAEAGKYGRESMPAASSATMDKLPVTANGQRPTPGQ